MSTFVFWAVVLDNYFLALIKSICSPVVQTHVIQPRQPAAGELINCTGRGIDTWDKWKPLLKFVNTLSHSEVCPCGGRKPCHVIQIIYGYNYSLNSHTYANGGHQALLLCVWMPHILAICSYAIACVNTVNKCSWWCIFPYSRRCSTSSWARFDLSATDFYGPRPPDVRHPSPYSFWLLVALLFQPSDQHSSITKHFSLFCISSPYALEAEGIYRIILGLYYNCQSGKTVYLMISRTVLDVLSCNLAPLIDITSVKGCTDRRFQYGCIFPYTLKWVWPTAACAITQLEQLQIIVWEVETDLPTSQLNDFWAFTLYIE